MGTAGSSCGPGGVRKSWEGLLSHALLLFQLSLTSPDSDPDPGECAGRWQGLPPTSGCFWGCGKGAHAWHYWNTLGFTWLKSRSQKPLRAFPDKWDSKVHTHTPLGTTSSCLWSALMPSVGIREKEMMQKTSFQRQAKDQGKEAACPHHTAWWDL